ncbi:MAG TPA: DapH/DapD/GlmU-related protein [Burkholderiales bacterium]
MRSLPVLRRFHVPAIRLPEWCHLIHTDYRRYRATEESALTTIFLTQGFWASCAYRFSRGILHGMRPGVPKNILKTFTALLQKTVEIVTGICIPRECNIGEGFYIGHYGTIILPRFGRIGHNCNVGQNVTIGIVVKGAKRWTPTIGNRVFIGAHSVIIGNLTIGDDAMICAGSVVTRSVPARGVVMGNPAKIISYEGSFDYISYDGMESDTDRRVSLEAARKQAASAADPAVSAAA